MAQGGHFKTMGTPDLKALLERHYYLRDSFNWDSSLDTIDGHPSMIAAELRYGQRVLDASIPFMEAELRQRGEVV